MSTRARSIAAVAALLLLASVSQVAAQIMIPTQQHENLSIVLQSLRDNIVLYKGDPQELLLMKVRPDRFRPRVEYESQTNAVLRIRDLYLAANPQTISMTAAERDRENQEMVAETWEIRLSPAGPTKFALQCERGESEFDFSDFEVQNVDIKTEETLLEVDFSGLNSIVLENFTAHVLAGTFQFLHMLNANAKEITLYVPEAICDFEVIGKGFEGETAINIIGVPAELRLLVSKKVGVRVTGPTATIGKFKASHMTQAGADWVSQGYEAATRKVRLTFGAEVPNLNLAWR